MVIHLGATLDIPLRERNQLLLQAGLAPEYATTPLDELGQIAGSLQFMVDAHSPYMAVVVDRLWNILIANRPATVFIQRLLGESVDWSGSPPNAMRLVFHPRGLSRHLVNFPLVARELLRWVERDAAIYPNDAPLRELVAELRDHAGADLVSSRDQGGDGLLLPLRYSVGGGTIELFTTIATIGAPLDVTLEELRIETFWPADLASDRAWRALVDRGGPA